MVSCLSPNGGTVASGLTPLNNFMVATLGGIYILIRKEGHAHWEIDRVTMEGKHISAILHEPRSGRIYAAVHGGGGLWVSEDDGYEWRPLEKGLIHPHVYTIAVQYRGEDTVLFAGAEPASLFRSDDLGESWTELASLRTVPEAENWVFPPPPHIAHVKNIAFHPDFPETLYVSVEQGGIFKSTDDGENWIELKDYLDPSDKFYRDIHRVLIRKDDPRKIVMSTGDGLYSSNDAGEHWEQRTSRHDRVGYPDAMFIDPRNEDRIYTAGSCQAPEDWREEKISYAAVVLSEDQGRSWRELKKGLPVPMVGNIEAMGLYSWADQLALTIGTATGDVYLSEDAGETWATVIQGIPPISKAGHYRWFMTEEERKIVEQGMWKWKDV